MQNEVPNHPMQHSMCLSMKAMEMVRCDVLHTFTIICVTRRRRKVDKKPRLSGGGGFLGYQAPYEILAVKR